MTCDFQQYCILTSVDSDLETPNGVQSVAKQLKNIQATSEGSVQTQPVLVAHNTLLELSCHGSFVYW